MSPRPGRGGSAARPLAALAGVAALAALVPVVSGSRTHRGGAPYLDGPPPGHTGGFGEPACQRCHFDAPVNPPEASLALEGFPNRFAPDTVYPLTIRVTAPELGAAGFEAAVRCSGSARAGRQAGELAAPGDRAESVRGGGGEFEGDSTVLYARHTREGSETTAPDTARWELAWTAPDGCRSAVLHAAANAANGDASEFGDRVLTGSWTAKASGVGMP